MSRRKGFRWEAADGFLMVTAVLWGINLPVAKIATERMPALPFNALRLVLATATLGICWWLETRSTREQCSSSPLPDETTSWLPGRILLFSLLSGLLYPMAFIQGVNWTTAGNTALILASMPMWTALLSKLVLKERLNRLTWSGLLITFWGTALIVLSQGSVEFSEEYLLGNLLMLTGAILWAGATVTSGPILKVIGPLKLAFTSSALTTPIHVAMNWDFIVHQSQVWLSPALLACILFSGVLSTGIAIATWNIGVRKVGGTHSAVYQNIVTLVAVLISWTLLGEPVLFLQLLGGGLALAGLFLMRRGRNTVPR